jgi:hypothetical protein
MAAATGDLVVQDTGGVRITTLRNVCIAYYCAELRAADIVAVTNAGVALGRKHPGGIVAFSIANGGVKLPDEDVRVAAAREMDRVRRLNRCAATVIEGTGFWAGAARSVVTAINLLGRPGFPTRVFGDVRTAAEWAQAFADPSDGAAEAITTAVAALVARPRLDPRGG